MIEQCPFCESKKTSIHEVTEGEDPRPVEWFIECNTCEAQGSGEKSEEEALENWNEVSKKVQRGAR